MSKRHRMTDNRLGPRNSNGIGTHIESQMSEEASEWLKRRLASENEAIRQARNCACGPKHSPERRYGGRWLCWRCGKLER